MRDTRHIYRDKQGRLIASIHLNGKQHLKRVASKEQAREWFLCMETQSTKAAELTFAQLNDAANALTMLRSGGVALTLTEVATQWLQSVSGALEGKQSPSLKDAMAEYEERSRARVAEKTLKGYMLMLNHFRDDMGEQTEVAAFTKADAVRYLDRFLDRPPTWRAYQRTLSKFFSECVRMEWTKSNPFANLDAPKCKPPERKFLTVPDTETAIQSVLKRKPRLIHFLTLGLFAGIRPIESLRLTSKHINLDTGYIRLDAGITKSHSFKERVVPINDTLRAWIEAYPFEDKPVPSTNINQVAKALQSCAAKDGWEKTPDVLRHSWCTYQFALTGNSFETASWAGHSEAVCQRHYRGRVTREEALKYFAILPSKTA